MSDSSALPAPGETASLLIPGPAGEIEALLAAPRHPRATSAFAVVCHPHPLFGGAMGNKVAYTLAACAQKAGLHALRFNFRGVGRSAGVHDQGRGETDDVLFLVEWMRQRLPGAQLALAGFSFGAFVSLRAAERVAPAAQVSVAPPFGKYLGDLGTPARPPCPWLVVHGDADDVVPYEETLAVLQGFQPAPQLATVQGAGHFFHGQLGELSEAVTPFLESALGG
ncbi:MAG TPA: alpha/beta fold hydrolase [Solimonas sp.]|nr:alpha/beta fold hydrolase [Solimonas sp.]